MKQKLHQVIRNHISKSADGGASVSDISRAVGKEKEAVRRSLKSMPDAYIDRWVLNTGRGQKYIAIWAVVEVPQNCPRPK